MGRKLSPTQTKKLKEALQTLPNEIQYLRMPILAIAKQDQGLLGCGEGDCSVFEEVWKQITTHLESSDATDLAVSHNKALQDWAAEVGDERALWLGPVWFLIGYFQGPAFGELPAIASLKSPESEVKVAIEIPRVFAFQEIGNGWSLLDKKVSIIVLPIPEADFLTLKNGMIERALMSPADLVKELILRDGHTHVCDASFRLKKATGLRYLELIGSSKQVFAARYFLSVPGGHTQILLNSLTEDGFSVETYESLIESIHVLPINLDG